MNERTFTIFLNQFFKNEAKEVIASKYPRHIITANDYIFLRHGYGSWLKHNYPLDFWASFKCYESVNEETINELMREVA